MAVFGPADSNSARSGAALALAFAAVFAGGLGVYLWYSYSTSKSSRETKYSGFQPAIQCSFSGPAPEKEISKEPKPEIQGSSFESVQEELTRCSIETNQEFQRSSFELVQEKVTLCSTETNGKQTPDFQCSSFGSTQEDTTRHSFEANQESKPEIQPSLEANRDSADPATQGPAESAPELLATESSEGAGESMNTTALFSQDWGDEGEDGKALGNRQQIKDAEAGTLGSKVAVSDTSPADEGAEQPTLDWLQGGSKGLFMAKDGRLQLSSNRKLSPAKEAGWPAGAPALVPDWSFLSSPENSLQERGTVEGTRSGSDARGRVPPRDEVKGSALPLAATVKRGTASPALTARADEAEAEFSLGATIKPVAKGGPQRYPWRKEEDDCTLLDGGLGATVRPPTKGATSRYSMSRSGDRSGSQLDALRPSASLQWSLTGTPSFPSTKRTLTDTAAAAPVVAPAPVLPTAKSSVQSTTDAGDGINISMEVIAGPAVGTKVSRKAEGNMDPWPSLTVGRVKANDLALNDSEVSSKHALVTWNALSARWELLDRGSLNGTMLNDENIHDESDNTGGRRSEGRAFQLKDGDIVTCGQSSRILVRIFADTQSVRAISSEAPFAVAVASDPMRARKGGKALPMEDVWHVEWPLRSPEGMAQPDSFSPLNDFGIFCIFDGHAGRAAADNVKRMLPGKLSTILMTDQRYLDVRQNRDATEVLRETFRQTEDALPNEDEGCTGTVLLVWRDLDRAEADFVGSEDASADGRQERGRGGAGGATDGHSARSKKSHRRGKRLWVQVANLGDSHCVLGYGDMVEVLTEDHRLTGPVERLRLESIGKPLPEGATRLCGMNIARVFGDKFLKQQDVGLSAQPFIHQPLLLPWPADDSSTDTPIAVIASDGLWDVLSPKRAAHIALEARRDKGGRKTLAEAMAAALLLRAKAAKTHDNTTVLALDFGSDP